MVRRSFTLYAANVGSTKCAPTVERFTIVLSPPDSMSSERNAWMGSYVPFTFTSNDVHQSMGSDSPRRVISSR